LTSTPPQLHIRSSKNEGSKRILPLNEAALGAVKTMIERADELGHQDPEHYFWVCESASQVRADEAWT